jgi:hypothetical protein
MSVLSVSMLSSWSCGKVVVWQRLVSIANCFLGGVYQEWVCQLRKSGLMVNCFFCPLLPTPVGDRIPR